MKDFPNTYTTSNITFISYLVRDTTSEITIYTDSKYVKDGITEWINKWKLNNWRSSNKKPVKNKDLWVKLDNCCQKHIVNWKWVKAHAGNKFNNLVDELAVSKTK